MSTLSHARTGTDPGRVRALVGAHRHAQAEHRSALAAESVRALGVADRRSQVILDALRRAGAEQLAAQLVGEAHAGTALIVALTSDDAAPAEVERALSAFHDAHAAVDTALRGLPDW
ncbi:MAG: hypothetical protein ACRDRK_22220 [Pseudonocardia sp.]